MTLKIKETLLANFNFPEYFILIALLSNQIALSNQLV